MKIIKKMNLNKTMKVLLITAILSLPALTQAQVAGDPPPPDGDPGAPIDGGLSLLLAAGAVYGVKKFRDGKRKQEEI